MLASLRRLTAAPGSVPGGLRRLSGFASVVPYKVHNPEYEGTLKAWKVSEGQTVVKGQPLCEIEMEEFSIDFASEADGYIADILIPENTPVTPREVIALMVDDEEDLHAYETQSLGADKVSPAARLLMLNNKLRLADVAGTGKNGRVTKGDVLASLGRAPAPQAEGSDGARFHAPEPLPPAPPAPAAPPASAPATAATTTTTTTATPSTTAPGTTVSTTTTDFPPPRGPYTDTAPSMVRKVIATRLTESKAKVPHLYATMDCRLDAVLSMRKTLAAAGVKVSVNDVIVKAAAAALRVVPEVNCSWDPATGDVKENDRVDISVAVATDGGLITPIVPDADKKGLFDINTTVKDLAGRARAGKLKPHEYQGGSFTISNLGMFGIGEFTAVINPPQSTIMAVGGGEGMPVVSDDGGVELATMMTVQVSCDRRVVDEGLAGQFLQAFRTFVESPALLV